MKGFGAYKDFNSADSQLLLYMLYTLMKILTSILRCCNVRSWTESPDKTKIEEWLYESAVPISTLPQSQLNPGLLIDLYLLDSLGKKLESHTSFEF